MMLIKIADDIPKHIKKKNSSVSKSQVKTNHKHQYEDVLFVDKEYRHLHKGTCCSICGKIGDLKIRDTEKLEDGRYRALSCSEMEEKYKDSSLPRVEIETVFEKYAPEFVNYIKDLDLENEREV